MTGAVVFRVEEQLHFLPANIAVKLLAAPDVARVPGGPEELVGVALVEGEMIPVVAIGELHTWGRRRSVPGERARSGSRPMLVCNYLGERIGLVGLDVVATGRFETRAIDEIEHAGAVARLFDVSAVVARLHEGRWAV